MDSLSYLGSLSNSSLSFWLGRLWLNDFAMLVSAASTPVRQSEALPFCVSLQLLDDPLAKDDRRLELFLVSDKHVRWDARQVLGFEEEWRRKALNTNVQHSVLRRLELEVRDAREYVSKVDDKLVVDGFDRLELSVEFDLETRVAKS